MVDKSRVEMFMALNSGVESPGLKHWVEKFDVEMSFNPLKGCEVRIFFQGEKQTLLGGCAAENI